MGLKSEDLGKTTLSIEAHVSKDALHLRQGVASAEVEDGRKVEVALNVDGALLVIVYVPNKKGWKTYALSPGAVVEAVLKVEDGEKNG